MKKIYGIFIALFLMSNVSFAGATTAIVDCYNVADSAATTIGNMFGLSYHQEFEVFNAVYDACINEQ